MLKSEAINLNRTPGVGLDQIGKVVFNLFGVQFIRAAVKSNL